MICGTRGQVRASSIAAAGSVLLMQQQARAARTFDLPRKRRSSLTAVRLAEAGRFLAYFFLPSRTSH